MLNTETTAWSRALDKYSPTKNVKYSPAIITQGKLIPMDLGQGKTTSLSWLLNANEEYYYQNIIELLSMNRKGGRKTNILLRKNRSDIIWPNILINFYLLGQGMFGTVYMASDAITKQKYAVKEVKVDKANFKNSLMNVIVERNAYFRANESTYVVKLCGAFQYIKSYWMVFEYCIGDLSTYLYAIETEMTPFMDMFLAGNFLEKMYSIYKRHLSLDIESIAFIYSFELLAGLDYLAKRNLVHRDIKPDNVLISTNGHLKIADLGLTQRVRWIDRNSTVAMVLPNHLKSIEDHDLNFMYAGNFNYTDPEANIYYKLTWDDNIIYNFIQSEYFPIKNGQQDFMSDLYAISLIIMELLFVGLNFVTTKVFSSFVLRDFDIKSDNMSKLLFNIRCIYEKNLNENYLMRILNNQITEKNRSLIEFLKSTFKPREIRARKYTKIISQFKLKRVEKSRCIDIEKIEDLDFYKSRNITTYNATMVTIPPIIMDILRKKTSELFATNMQILKLHQEEEETSENIQQMPYFDYAK